MATVWIKTLFGFWVSYPAPSGLLVKWWTYQARYCEFPFYIEWHTKPGADHERD